MDFEPIALVATNPMLIVAKKAMPANDLKGFIAWLKANPGKASQGTFGAGSVGHIVGIFFQNTTGARYQFVPYRGGPQDLVAGQIDMMIDNPVTSLPQVRAGGIKAYVVAAKNRLTQGAGNPHRGRSRFARAICHQLAGALCTQGHAEGCRRQA